MKLNILFLFLLAAILSGCTDKGIVPSKIDAESEDKINAYFYLLTPLPDLPSTRAINDDSEFHNYTIWVFENNFFQEAINNDKINYDGHNGGVIEIPLNKEWTKVRLMMIANVNVNPPSPETPWNDAEVMLQNAIFTYTGNENYMPMYGTSGNAAFAVKQGINGTIQLKRCMARVVINAKEAATDNFTLETVNIYNVNTKGTVAQVYPIKNQETYGDSIKGYVDQVNNIGIVYIPERVGLNDGDDGKTRTSVVIKGLYKSKEGVPIATKYYRLEFIKRVISNGGVVIYKAIDTIKRNYSYNFNIDYLLDCSGVSSLNEALINPATNKKGDNIKVNTIEDDGIMDITTDNYTYLGVTSGRIDAILNTDGTYYAAQISVMTNDPNGWAMDALPKGVSATIQKWTPDPSLPVTSIQSVWVFLPKTIYNTPGEEVKLYIYSGNIRKSIIIVIPTFTP